MQNEANPSALPDLRCVRLVAIWEHHCTVRTISSEVRRSATSPVAFLHSIHGHRDRADADLLHASHRLQRDPVAPHDQRAAHPGRGPFTCRVLEASDRPQTIQRPDGPWIRTRDQPWRTPREPWAFRNHPRSRTARGHVGHRRGSPHRGPARLHSVHEGFDPANELVQAAVGQEHDVECSSEPTRAQMSIQLAPRPEVMSDLRWSQIDARLPSDGLDHPEQTGRLHRTRRIHEQDPPTVDVAAQVLESKIPADLTSQVDRKLRVSDSGSPSPPDERLLLLEGSLSQLIVTRRRDQNRGMPPLRIAPEICVDHAGPGRVTDQHDVRRGKPPTFSRVVHPGVEIRDPVHVAALGDDPRHT